MPWIRRNLTHADTRSCLSEDQALSYAARDSYDNRELRAKEIPDHGNRGVVSVHQ